MEGLFSPRMRRSQKTPRLAVSALWLWHDEDFLRVGILYFATRRVTTDVNVAVVRIEWVKNQARFARHWLCHRKLCRRWGGWLCLCSWSCSIGLTRGHPGRRGWRRNHHRMTGVCDVRRIRRRRFGLAKDIAHWRSNHSSNSAADQSNRGKHQSGRSPIHRALYKAPFV